MGPVKIKHELFSKSESQRVIYIYCICLTGKNACTCITTCTQPLLIDPEAKRHQTTVFLDAGTRKITHLYNNLHLHLVRQFSLRRRCPPLISRASNHFLREAAKRQFFWWPGQALSPPPPSPSRLVVIETFIFRQK